MSNFTAEIDSYQLHMELTHSLTFKLNDPLNVTLDLELKDDLYQIFFNQLYDASQSK